MEGYAHDPILVPKDSYAVRPLPFRIGSAAFREEEDVGLGDYASDSEGIYVHVDILYIYTLYIVFYIALYMCRHL